MNASGDSLADSAPERLIVAAIEISREEGLAALTARALGLRTGMSPSALNYHLGGRESLVEHVAAHALKASEAWRSDRRKEIGDDTGAPAWLSPAGVMAALIGDRVSNFRTWNLLLEELAFEADAKQSKVLAERLAGDVSATTALWAEAAQALGEDVEASMIWADLADGLTQLLLGDEPAAAKTPWIVDAAERLHARLHRHPLAPLKERSASASDRLHSHAPASESARKLLDAALKIIAEKGADRLTQREVASAAGLSLAATTYFFRTKAELVSAAFHELHRQVSAAALSSPEGTNQRLRLTLEDEDERQSWRVRAMEALQLRSARDTSLAPLARELRATRGATSIVWLRSIGVEADRLDAFVFSTAMSGVVHRTRFAPTEVRRHALAESEQRLLRGLFAV
jgi:AcrR family transcriptional regulator